MSITQAGDVTRGERSLGDAVGVLKAGDQPVTSLHGEDEYLNPFAGFRDACRRPGADLDQRA